MYIEENLHKRALTNYVDNRRGIAGGPKMSTFVNVYKGRNC